MSPKYNLDRTGMKKMAKFACIGMLRMHFLDLRGLYVFWTPGLTTVITIVERDTTRSLLTRALHS